MNARYNRCRRKLDCRSSSFVGLYCHQQFTGGPYQEFNYASSAVSRRDGIRKRRCCDTWYIAILFQQHDTTINQCKYTGGGGSGGGSGDMKSREVVYTTFNEYLNLFMIKTPILMI